MNDHDTQTQTTDSTIPVTVYTRPHGEQRDAVIHMPNADVCAHAQTIIDAGFHFALEELGMGTTAVYICDNGEGYDLAIFILGGTGDNKLARLAEKLLAVSIETLQDTLDNKLAYDAADIDFDEDEAPF